jgi:hypothetical protein
VIERLKTKGCVPDPAAEAQESVGSLSSVAARIAAIRRRDDRLRCRRQRKTGDREHRERGINKFRYCFHVFVSFHYFLWILRTEVDHQ